MNRCEFCERVFEPTREGQRFCVGRGCRQAWHRANDAANKSGEEFDRDHPYPVGVGSRYAFLCGMKPKIDSKYIECDGDKKRKKNERNRAHDYAKLHGFAITTRSERTGFRVWVRYED